MDGGGVGLFALALECAVEDKDASPAHVGELAMVPFTFVNGTIQWRTIKWCTIKWCTSLKTLSNTRSSTPLPSARFARWILRVPECVQCILPPMGPVTRFVSVKKYIIDAT